MPQQDNHQTTIKDLMTHDLEVISADSTLREAAEKMQAVDCGVLPVGTREKLEGIITDRDIVIRAVAAGKDPNREIVRDYMTPGVCACHEDDTTEQAAQLMHANNVNRLIVERDDGSVCGIITFGRILRKNDNMHEVTSVVECAVGRKAA